MLLHEERLEGVHPDLQRVVRKAGESQTMAVLEGLRSVERERDLIAQGHSGLKDPLRCRHVTGHAVDVAPVLSHGGKTEVRWDWPAYPPIATAMKDAAKALNVPIEWGGDWHRFPDGPHFQLPWKNYPLQ